MKILGVTISHISMFGIKERKLISIEDSSVLAGEFPSRQLRLVLAWIEIHREELIADWELAISGEEPFRINPLQ